MFRKAIFLVILFLLNSCASTSNTISKDIIPDTDIADESFDINPKSSNKQNIALLVPKTGNSKNIANSVIQASQIAINEDKTKKLNLKIYNSELIASEPEFLQTEFKNNNIKAIVGPVYTKETLKLSQILANKTPVIFSLSNDSSLNENSVVIMGSSPYSQTVNLINFAINQGIDDFHLLLPSSKYGKITESAVQNLITEKNNINYNVTWYNQENAEISIKNTIDIIASSNKKDLKKRAIFMPQGGNLLSHLNKALTSNKLKIQLIGSQAWDNQEILDYPYFNGALLVAKRNETDETFFNKYKDLFNSDAISVDLAAYNSIKLIEKMLKNHQNFSKEDLMNSYPEYFDEQGNLIEKATIMQIQNKQFKILE